MRARAGRAGHATATGLAARRTREATSARGAAAGFAKRWVRIAAGGSTAAPCRRELAAQGIELRGGAADEAPDAYKRLDRGAGPARGTVACCTR